MSPSQILASVAVAIGEEEFERTGKPESVRPRHFAIARAALEAASSAIYVRGGGALADHQNYGSHLLGEAIDAPGPDQRDGGGQ